MYIPFPATLCTLGEKSSGITAEHCKKQGCGSGPISAGSGSESSKSKNRIRILLALTKNQFKHLIFSHQINCFSYLNDDYLYFYLKKWKIHLKMCKSSFFKIFFPCLYNFTLSKQGRYLGTDRKTLPVKIFRIRPKRSGSDPIRLHNPGKKYPKYFRDMKCVKIKPMQNLPLRRMTDSPRKFYFGFEFFLKISFYFSIFDQCDKGEEDVSILLPTV